MPPDPTQHAEVEANHVAFLRERAALLATDPGRFAVYRSGKRIAIVDAWADALGVIQTTGGFPASAQEITDRTERCYVNV